MANLHSFLWLLFFAILVWCTYWHITENKRLDVRWRKNMDARSAEWLSRFTWTRSIQFLTALACAIVVIVAYDLQLKDARNELSEYAKLKLQVKQLAAKSERQAAAPSVDNSKSVAMQRRPVNTAVSQPQAYYPPAVQPSAAIAQPPIAAKPIQSSPVSSVPVELSDIPAESQPASNDLQAIIATEGMGETPDSMATSATPAANAAPSAGGASVTNVYEPEQVAVGDQAVMDRIKKRYEDVLVTYFFLKKCGRAEITDFHIINSALSQEMASVNAPGRMQNDILTAAKGSYEEMYATSSCQGEGFNSLHTQYVDYISTLSRSFSERSQ